MARVLTADLGNSALKLRLFRSAEGARCVGEDAADLAVGPALERELAAWLERVDRIDRAAYSSVATVDAGVAVVRALDAAAGGALALAPDPGLDVRCREPAAVGRDRLYAARAALAATGASEVIVLDCGTALTVDAARAPGVFEGGAIAPGPALLARALGAGAARLFEVAPEPGAPALGRDTAGALASGVVHGLRGAARELARAVAREAGFARPAHVVTGGARRFLLAPEPALERVLEVPDLVHHGLLLALGLAPPEGPWSR